MGNKQTQFDATAAPPVDDSARAEYKPENAKVRRADVRDANAEERKEDHLYGIASRARWGSQDIAELHRDTLAIEGSAAASRTSTEEEEEEEEETDANDLTVAQLKEALDEAEVEYAKDAKKADLVALYEEHGLGDAE